MSSSQLFLACSFAIHASSRAELIKTLVCTACCLFRCTVSASRALCQGAKAAQPHLLPELDLPSCCCWLACPLPLLVVDGCWAAKAAPWLANTLCSRIRAAHLATRLVQKHPHAPGQLQVGARQGTPLCGCCCRCHCHTVTMVAIACLWHGQATCTELCCKLSACRLQVRTSTASAAGPMRAAWPSICKNVLVCSGSSPATICIHTYR